MVVPFLGQLLKNESQPLWLVTVVNRQLAIHALGVVLLQIARESVADFMGESGVNQLRVIMNNRNGEYLIMLGYNSSNTCCYSISVCPIMYKHKSVDGCMTPFNHS